MSNILLYSDTLAEQAVSSSVVEVAPRKWKGRLETLKTGTKAAVLALAMSTGNWVQAVEPTQVAVAELQKVAYTRWDGQVVMVTPAQKARMEAIRFDAQVARQEADAATQRADAATQRADAATQCNDIVHTAGTMIPKAVDMKYVLDYMDRYQSVADKLEECDSIIGVSSKDTYDLFRKSVRVALKWAGQDENVALNTGSSNRGHAQKVSTTAATGAVGVKNPDQKVEN